jgi:hypothetical protein
MVPVGMTDTTKVAPLQGMIWMNIVDMFYNLVAKMTDMTDYTELLIHRTLLSCQCEVSCYLHQISDEAKMVSCNVVPYCCNKEDLNQ